jgi:transposase
VKARTAAINQIKGLLVSAPDKLRAKYRGLGTSAMITALQRTRPSGHIADPEYVCLLTLKALATRCHSLAAEIAAADAALQDILDTYAPMLCDLPGVGTEVASQLLVTAGDNPERLANEVQFAAFVGVAPIPASSGKTTRHRLSRGGDRNANHALHQVVLVRMASCQRTKDYVAKRTAEGKSKREIMRCLTNGYWLVWCLLAGWLPVLLDLTPRRELPPMVDRASSPKHNLTPIGASSS